MLCITRGACLVINVFVDDRNEYYKFGLLHFLNEIIGLHTDQKINLLHQEKSLSKADIIVRVFPAGAETLCHPELVGRKLGSLLISIYEGDIQMLKLSPRPHCFDNTMFIHRTERINMLAKKFIYAWARARVMTDRLHGCRQGCRSCSSVELSLQEIKIISYITYGFTLARVANILGLSVKTVSAHKRRVMRKFNIKSNAELIILCRATLQVTNQSKVCFLP